MDLISGLSMLRPFGRITGSMGLSLHYHGSLGDPARLAELVAELEDIAESMGWESHRITRDDGNPEFEGIILNTDDGTEPLPFLFDRNDRLRTLADLICHQFKADPRCSYYVSVKTQFGQIPTHLWICGLLRYLKSKYLPDLQVNDEGEYYETGNLSMLTERRDFLTGKIREIAEGLSTVSSRAETPEELVAEIEKYFCERGEGI